MYISIQVKIACKIKDVSQRRRWNTPCPISQCIGHHESREGVKFFSTTLAFFIAYEITIFIHQYGARNHYTLLPI